MGVHPLSMVCKRCSSVLHTLVSTAKKPAGEVITKFHMVSSCPTMEAVVGWRLRTLLVGRPHPFVFRGPWKHVLHPKPIPVCCQENLQLWWAMMKYTKT